MRQSDTAAGIRQGRRRGQKNDLALKVKRSLRLESERRVIVTRNHKQRQMSKVEDSIPVEGSGGSETNGDCPDEWRGTRESGASTLSSSSVLSTSSTSSIVTSASISSTLSTSSTLPILSTSSVSSIPSTSSALSTSSTPSALPTSSTISTPSTLSTSFTSSTLSTSSVSSTLFTSTTTSTSPTISTSSTTSTMPVMLDVSCGSNSAQLRLEDLRGGSRGSCVLLNDIWMTPNEFQSVSGRGNAKDWKRSIKHHHRPLKFLLEQGLLSASPPFCICETCDSQTFDGSPKISASNNVPGTRERKKGHGAKDRKSTTKDLRRKPATGRRTSKPEVDGHSNQNGGRQRRQLKDQVRDGVDLGEAMVDGRKRVREQGKVARKGVRKEGCSRKKKGMVEEPFQGRVQPVNDEDSKTIIDSGELYMETEQSVKVAGKGLMDGMNEKTEEVTKDVAEYKGGAPSGRQEEANRVVKLNGKVESRRSRAAARVTEREEKERLPGVQSSRVDGEGSEAWKEFKWEETTRRDLDGRREELAEDGESRRLNGHGSERDGNMNEEMEKTILDRNEDTTMEEVKEEIPGKDEERDEKRSRRLIRGEKSRNRTENGATKNQKLRRKTGRTETILVVPNYQRETMTLLDASSIKKNSNENNDETSAETEDSFQLAVARDALKKTAPRKSDKAFDDKLEVTPQRAMTVDVEKKKPKKSKGHRTVTSKMADSTTKVDAKGCNMTLEIAKDVTLEVQNNDSRKEKTLIESTDKEDIDISAYYRPPEVVLDNPPFPFHPSGVISTGEDNQSDGGLLTTMDRSNPLSGVKIPLEKRGSITGSIPGSPSPPTGIGRKRKTPPEVTDTTISGRRRRRRNQNGVVSSTTADFQVADPPAMTSQKEDWSRGDGGNHGAGCHGDVTGRRSFLAASGFSSGPDGDVGEIGGVLGVGGCTGGTLGDGKHRGGTRCVGGRDIQCTQGGHDGSFGAKSWQLGKSKDSLCRQRPQTSQVEIPSDRCNITEYERRRHAWMIPAFPQQGETDNRVRWNRGAAERGEDTGGKRVTENPEENTRMGWTAAPRGTGVFARTEFKPIFDSCGALDLTLPKTRNN